MNEANNSNFEASDGYEEWSHFHFKCYETLPGWDAIQEANFKELLGNAYEQEMLAEFGKDVKSILNPEDIDKAEEKGKAFNYSYTDKLYPHYGYPLKWQDQIGFTVLGVDWDKFQSGPSIVITKFYADPSMHYDSEYFWRRIQCQVIKHVIIPQAEFVYTEAVTKIVKLVSDFNVDYVYCDEGDGEMQIESLKKSFIDNKIIPAQNVERIPFQSSREYINPITREKEKMMAKPLMVTLLQQCFQGKSITINNNDKVMLNQLRDYCVIGYSQTGHPQFSKINEHSVDALMLCLLCAHEKLTDFSKLQSPNPEDAAFVDMQAKYHQPKETKRTINDICEPLQNTPYNNTGVGIDGERRPIIVRTISYKQNSTFKRRPSINIQGSRRKQI
jgi:hypothetical protein